MSKTPLPFGCWPSVISAAFVAGKALRFSGLEAQGGTLYWSESRPEEKGRVALVSKAEGAPVDLLQEPFSVGTQVHEYGGKAFLVTGDDIYFINSADQDIWRLKPGRQPERITNEPQLRFADLVHDRKRNRLIAVGERHLKNKRHPQNLLVSIPLTKDLGKNVLPLIEGDDFYASPTLSPDQDRLAFISWNLPDMPWESARIGLATFKEDGSCTTVKQPEGLDRGACFQPQWHPDGQLYVINDHSGFGQLYRLEGDETIPVTMQLPQMEFGLPQWVFGMKTYAFTDRQNLVAAVFDQGVFHLYKICLESGNASKLSDKLCSLDVPVVSKGKLAGFASRPDTPPALIRINPDNGDMEITRKSAELNLPAGDISAPESLQFATEHGETVQGYYYAPISSAYCGLEGELPPVILTAHGGPTGISDCGLKLKIQYWTNRGFGYFDVNYSGSWGFGKAYRQRLDHHWGERDVADMHSAAEFLVQQQLADPKRLLISGSSAGGYTVLMVLATSNLFAAGASYYGISDIGKLRDSTHKFEAGYLDRLLGLDGLIDEQTLEQRSPLHLAGNITSPIIFFQGLKDKVVPPDQALMMVNELTARGIPVAYETFAEEGHGFRQSATIKTALEMEYAFYAQQLGLDNEV